MIPDENPQHEYEIITLSDKEIFIKIWTSPRFIFSYLNDNNYDKYVNLLLILAGLDRALDTAVSKNFGDKMSLLSILGFSVIGGIMWWAFYHLYAALIQWTGRWLNGKGTTRALVRMFAYALFPAIVGLAFFLPLLFIFGNEMFQTEVDLSDVNVILTVVYYLFLFVQVVLTVWSVVLVVIGISVVQKMSIGKSILNMILPGVVIMVPLIILVMIFHSLK